MEATFEGIIHWTNDKNYHDVATVIYEAYKDKLTGARESWLDKIENKLKSIHEGKLSTGLYSKTRKEIGGEACAETIEWLEKELGIEKEVETIGRHLGFF